jgi:ESF2/ABP1 family protein
MSRKRKISSSDNDEPQEQQQPTSSVESDDKVLVVSKTKKKSFPGVIYLSRIPNKMNVTIIRSYFDQYGQTGRIYLELSSKSFFFLIEKKSFFLFSKENEVKNKRERGPKYTEGWVEFKSKRDAKLIAKQLNNQQVGGRRRTPWFDEIWNIK